MTKRLFNELAGSIKEAGKIHRGEIQPSREFVCDPDEDVVREELYDAESDTHGN